MVDGKFQDEFTPVVVNQNFTEETKPNKDVKDGKNDIKSPANKVNIRETQDTATGDYKFGRYINFMSDTGFKAVFGDEANKVCIINFLNSILPEDKKVVSLEFMQNEYQLESNPERGFRLDLLCKDEKGRMFIIEMQNYRQKDFLERAFIYAADIYSRNTRKGSGVFKGIPTYFIGILGTGYSGEIYESATKGTINIRHTSTEYSDDIYGATTEGTNNIRHTSTIYSGDISGVSTTQQVSKTELPVLSYCGMCDFTIQKRMPIDFFLIFVRLGKFTKRFEECENDQERWFYLFKNLHNLAELPEGLEGTAFERFATAAEFSAYNQDKRQEIKSDMMREHDYYAILETYKLDGIEAGHKRGLVEGRAEEKIDIAKKMLIKGMSVNSIAELTGLSEEEIFKFRADS